MSVETYLGNPPANIRAWIEQHSQPSDHSDSRVTYTQTSGHEDWSGEIVGALTNTSIPYIEDVETVDIGTLVTSIGDNSFAGCSNLTKVIIGNGITTIAYDVFYGCDKLTSVVFQGKTLEQVQNIEDGEENKYYPWGIEDTSIIRVA